MGTDNKDSIKEKIRNLELFEKYVNEWIKYKDNFKDITVGEYSKNKEAQKNDYLIQIEVYFNQAILEIDKDPKNKLINPNEIEELIQRYIRKNVIFSLDKEKEVKTLIKEKFIQYLQELKENVKEKSKNKNYKTLNFKEFVYLCFELGLVNNDVYNADRKKQANEIREIYEKYEHPIFDKIKLKNTITNNTDIYSIVRQYNSGDKDNNTVKKIKTIIKDSK